MFKISVGPYKLPGKYAVNSLVLKNVSFLWEIYLRIREIKFWGDFFGYETLNSLLFLFYSFSTSNSVLTIKYFFFKQMSVIFCINTILQKQNVIGKLRKIHCWFLYPLTEQASWTLIRKSHYLHYWIHDFFIIQSTESFLSNIIVTLNSMIILDNCCHWGKVKITISTCQNPYSMTQIDSGGVVDFSS